MVTPPASTGMMSISRNAVTSQAQQNMGILNMSMPGARSFKMVTMMLIEARMEEIPRICTVKMRKSMAIPTSTESGGYRVHPVLICDPPPGKKGTANDNISMMAAA